MKIYQEETAVASAPFRRFEPKNRPSLISSKHTGRTPLKPRNHQSSHQSSPIHAFRRSLKETTRKGDSEGNGFRKMRSSSSKSIGNASGIENRRPQNPTSSAHQTSTESGSRTSSSPFWVLSNEKSTTGSKFVETSETSSSAVTTNSLRKSLRETISPHAGRSARKAKVGAGLTVGSLSKRDSVAQKNNQQQSKSGKRISFQASTRPLLRRHGKQTSGHGIVASTSMGPPQRLLPRTPNSLLRTEMNTTAYEEDESLLVCMNSHFEAWKLKYRVVWLSALFRTGTPSHAGTARATTGPLPISRIL